MCRLASRPTSPRVRSANVRTALVLASIALVFFVGIIFAKFIGDTSTGMTVLGAAVLLFLVVAIGRNLRNERAGDDAIRPSRAASSSGPTARSLKRLCVVVVGMFAFGFAAGAVLREDLRGHRACATSRSADEVREHAGRSRAQRAHRARLEPAQPAVDVQAARAGGRRASGRGTPGRLRGRRTRPSRPITGQAIPSYGPQHAAQYFQKLDCFCFAKQTLQPGEVRKMPVVFVVDPKAPADLAHDHAVVHVLRSRRNGGRSVERPASRLDVKHDQERFMTAAADGAKPYYYVPQPSHWPITGSIALLLMGSGAAFWFNGYPRRDRGWSRSASRSCSTCCSAGSAR